MASFGRGCVLLARLVKMSVVSPAELFQCIYEYWGLVPLFSDWPMVESWLRNERKRRILWLEFNLVRAQDGRRPTTTAPHWLLRAYRTSYWSDGVTWPSKSERCRDIWDSKRRKMRRHAVSSSGVQTTPMPPPCISLLPAYYHPGFPPSNSPTITRPSPCFNLPLQPPSPQLPSTRLPPPNPCTSLLVIPSPPMSHFSSCPECSSSFQLRPSPIVGAERVFKWWFGYSASTSKVLLCSRVLWSENEGENGHNAKFRIICNVYKSGSDSLLMEVKIYSKKCCIKCLTIRKVLTITSCSSLQVGRPTLALVLDLRKEVPFTKVSPEVSRKRLKINLPT